MTHLRCPRGTGGATAGQTPAEVSGLDPGNLFLCPRHDDDTTMSPNSSPDASNSLRLRLAPGDVVLILEFSNALLPPSTKKAAPDAANHWGIVTSAEETEPLGHGNQLLSVRTFADESVLVVPNRYVLRVASAVDFSLPVDLIRHCLQRHAMAELQLCHLEGDVPDTATNNILRASNAAFAARLEALGISEAQAMSDAEVGLARWRRFQALPSPRQYDGLGDSAPIYLYVDTHSTPSTQDTNMQSTQGIQQDNDQQSQASSASEDIAVSTNAAGANIGNKRPANARTGEKAKRQKIGPAITTSATATTPSARGLLVTPGVTSSAFVMLDLVSLHSFRELETVVRTRLVGALGQRTRYTREIFGMDAHQAQRWLEQQRRKKYRDQPPLSIWRGSASALMCTIFL
ncbi:hypothetical protein BBJ29_002738 [Phytophthora kernoviae]|uniref:Uncharacterized protein n=1 Tax=Phytophthora kernoviae TaxID=325452 RepID=A0A3R7JE26_9STRA|nr:hypothetical protein BBJ29_002738 [Phytophthora kernoviae]